MTPDKLDQLRRFAKAAKQGPDGVLGSLVNAVPVLCDEVEKLTAELRVAFSPGMYLDIQQVLDRALGTKESDGAGAGIVADVALLAEQRDEAREQVAVAEDRRAGAVLRERQALAERDEALAAIDRVRARHQPRPGKHLIACENHQRYESLCVDCRFEPITVCSNIACCGWPCDTRKTLDGSGT